MADASVVFAIESWFGDSPANMPNTSFSDDARVARPNRVHRKRAPSASAMMTTTPAIQKRLIGIELPKTSTMSVGNTLGIAFEAEPNHSNMVAWRISRMPSEATSLASGDDVRSGRNTSSSLNTPTRIATAIVTMTAGTVPSVTLKKPVLSAQKPYADTIAMAPVARLMIPEPRNVITTAMAIPAITAPPPRPSSTKRMTSFMTCSALAADVRWGDVNRRLRT